MYLHSLFFHLQYMKISVLSCFHSVKDYKSGANMSDSFKIYFKKLATVE